MPTFGLFFLLAGTLLLRQVAVGRTDETVTDLRDLALATLSGDAVAIQTVLQRRGKNAEVSSDVGSDGTAAPTDSTSVISRDYSTVRSDNAIEVLQTAQRLGRSAKGYRWGFTGPEYFDCSGLIWRTLRTVNLYSGGRFTTTTFSAVAPRFAKKVEDYAVGDIVVWPGKHMGIVNSPTDYYSARSVAKGIGFANLKDDIDYFSGVTPEFWRLN